MRGYIIAHCSFSNEDALLTGYHTFGTTAGEAWLRFIGERNAASLDRPAIVQAWSQRGYVPRTVELNVVSH